MRRVPGGYPRREAPVNEATHQGGTFLVPLDELLDNDIAISLSHRVRVPVVVLPRLRRRGSQLLPRQARRINSL
ncbi:Uncharacterised protein [Mycobacteroides abscessus subsp. abscessus]|nr:Uncharacterised protein [Mycobacteroides abscessus subsp. abscessus]